ncbi:RHS repeat domain-containing protein, partial [Dyadobacter sp. BHUBP1]|uniref:RHS repeat domain-containing protein n=1 Tax=Dyadobacter sp. BHUBP1 TaxID=3424178 RepID=UPI003D332661
LMDSKYVPGGGTTTMTYDSRDRLIESKDGNNKITYFKYDDLNRVIETGEKVGTEYRAFAKTHYDNYSPPFGAAQAFVGNYGNGYPSTYRSDVKGKVTVTATRILNPDGTYSDQTSGWYYITNYYDDRFNLIQTIRGLFDLGGDNQNYEHVVRQLRFDGRVEKELILQKVSTGEHTVEKQYEYDHSDRLLSIRYIVKRDGTEKKNIVVAASRYNGLGQLKKKFLNSTDASTFREQLDYSYIPRGWMSKVTGKTSAGENFGVELKYANATVPQYNGNIGDMLWKRGGAWVGYKFTYDEANRLTKGEGLNNDYSETVSSYDLNGNIKALQRKNGAAIWDNLSYDYVNGNRLNKVTDTGTTEGFSNGSSGDGVDYDYDGNGNAIRDQNRGIGNGGIRYNILNLIREVDVNGLTMKYHYDAAGTKLRMQRGTDNTKYAGIFEYNGSNYISRIATEEGQINIANNGASASDYSFEYYLKDHLGNVRQVINESGMLLQEMEYFPFGLAIPRTVGTNKYLYNGKEKQPETGLFDYGARQYDPAIGRWMVIDPMAELDRKASSYTYVFNNPLRFIDPDGMFGDYYDANGKYLGNDGIDDNKVYVADSKNERGGFDNAQELSVTHSEFTISANVVKHESSGDKDESLWIAHAANNAKDNNAIDYKKKNETLNDQLTDKSYSTTPASARTQLSDKDDSNAANNARAAVISVLSGKADPTGGAVLWDGSDFLKKGGAHNKFKEYSTVTIGGDALQKYSAAYKRSTASPDFCDALANKSSFVSTGKGKYYSLESTGAAGKSIFWKIGKK